MQNEQFLADLGLRADRASCYDALREGYFKAE
jgi:hypothetical protein